MSYFMSDYRRQDLFRNAGWIIGRSEQIDGYAHASVENFKIGYAQLTRLQVIDPGNFDFGGLLRRGNH